MQLIAPELHRLVLPIIIFAKGGFRSNQSATRSFTKVSTMPFTSAFARGLVLVWPSNCGSRTFTLMTAQRPSRISSPSRLPSRSLTNLLSAAYRLPVRVSAARKPTKMCTAFDRIDVVAIGINRLGVRIVPLHGDFGFDIFFFSFKINNVGVNRFLRLVHMRNKFDDAFFRNEILLSCLCAHR